MAGGSTLDLRPLPGQQSALVLLAPRGRRPEDLREVVEHLREDGSPYLWWVSTYLQYVVGQHAYWAMGASVENTELIDRKSLERVWIDELRNTGGGGFQWRWLHCDVEADRAKLRRQESARKEPGDG